MTRSRRSGLIGPVLIAGALLLLWFTRKTTAAKRSELINYFNAQSDGATAAQATATMSDQEVEEVYDFIFDYFQKGVKPAPGSDLYNEMNAISAKYNIFT